MQIFTTRDLADGGHSRRGIARLYAAGELARVARGRYITQGKLDDVLTRHLALILAQVPRLPPDAMVSHESAAVLHGLPLPPGEIGAVRIIRTARACGGGGRRTSNVVSRRAAVAADQSTVVMYAGMPIRVTTPARTVAELSLQSLPWGVAAGDFALRTGLTTKAELSEVVTSLGTRKGIARARRLAGFVDDRAESAAESISRVFMSEAGLPIPELQLWVGNHERRIARLDFAWEAYRVDGECDGFGKYLDASQGSPAGALRREKQRDSDLADLGWTPVHWTYPEIFDGRMVARIRRVLMRNGWDGRPLAPW